MHPFLLGSQKVKLYLRKCSQIQSSFNVLIPAPIDLNISVWIYSIRAFVIRSYVPHCFTDKQERRDLSKETNLRPPYWLFLNQLGLEWFWMGKHKPIKMSPCRHLIGSHCASCIPFQFFLERQQYHKDNSLIQLGAIQICSDFNSHNLLAV